MTALLDKHGLSCSGHAPVELSQDARLGFGSESEDVFWTTTFTLEVDMDDLEAKEP